MAEPADAVADLLGSLRIDCAPGGYFKQPTLHASAGLVFACEGDLWRVDDAPDAKRMRLDTEATLAAAAAAVSAYTQPVAVTAEIDATATVAAPE